MPYHIFLVEDHPILRQAYASFFMQQADFDLCGMGGSAEEALDTADWAACDLLLTDLALPGMDGIELVRHVLAERPDLPTVVVSVHDEAATVDRALAVGALAYLRKVGLGTTLAERLREVLQGEHLEGRSGAHA